MRAVRIAELKSRLSEHLRAVRRGHSLTVMDRSTPVARIVPFETANDVVITRPAPDAPPIGRWKPPPLPKELSSFDVLAYLERERQSHR